MEPPRNVRLDVAYRGTPFHGFAENDGVRTVAGDLRAALERILQAPIELAVAGRTDAGVHARGQVVSFRTNSHRLDLGRLVGSLNKLCGPDIVVLDATPVADDFDARFSAMQRRYEYSVHHGAHPDPLRQDVEWHVPYVLDLEAMERAAVALTGEHDFTSFCRRPKDRPAASLVRHVRIAGWERVDDQRLRFTVAADAFCHQMVRALTGFCVAVGRGQRDADEVPAVLAARDRSAAAPIAPPHGLVLVEVTYPDGAEGSSG